MGGYVLLVLLSSGLFAQRSTSQRPGAPSEQRPVAIPVAPWEDKAPIVTRHEVTVGGRTLKYSVSTGMLPIRNESGEVEASIFHVAYTLDTDQPKARRPLTFSFNGGPGSSSVWLHLGAIGPKRVRLNDDGTMPPPPYELIPNEATWLAETDLVFIDPVGTGFSRATKPELARKFNSVEGDIACVGEFIRMYLSRAERWSSPLFIVGESYGTTRAAGLSGHLIDRGIALNGVILVSTVLNFQTIRFSRGNDLPYILYLPTYSAAAWYHKKLPPEMKDLRKTLAEVKAWAESDYAVALAKGDRLSAAERGAVIEKLTRYTGLSKTFLDQNNVRIEIQRFIKELLRDRKITVGRLDSRLTGFDGFAGAEFSQFDPSNNAITPPYTATWNNYVRSELGYKNDNYYYILGGGIAPWDWGSAAMGFNDLADSLRNAFAKNPHMRLMVASGYYDLATPFFATEYTLGHMNLPPGARERIRVHEYEAGHMMYIHVDSLKKLKQDVSTFIINAVPKQ